VILGTATPSLESYYHGKTGKYGWVKLDERYGGTILPKVTMINLVEEKKNKWRKYVAENRKTRSK
jgi:primosomal protein N' (replication factor Y)